MLANRVRMGVQHGDNFGKPYAYNNGEFKEYWGIGANNISNPIFENRISSLYAGQTISGSMTISHTIPIDLTGIKSVKIQYKIYNTESANLGSLYVNSTKVSSHTSATKYMSLLTSNGSDILTSTLDVTSITGNNYIQIGSPRGVYGQLRWIEVFIVELI